jgi:hypothetical protein
MPAFHQSAVRTLDLGDTSIASAGIRPCTRTRLVTGARISGTGVPLRVLPWRGREKYQVLEHRRRQAQIRARRALAALGHDD